MAALARLCPAVPKQARNFLVLLKLACTLLWHRRLHRLSRWREAFASTLRCGLCETTRSRRLAREAANRTIDPAGASTTTRQWHGVCGVFPVGERRKNIEEGTPRPGRSLVYEGRTWRRVLELND